MRDEIKGQRQETTELQHEPEELKHGAMDLLAELISIDSSNSFLIKGAPGSTRVQRFIRDYLTDLGIETELQVIDENHSNLKATIKGKSQHQGEHQDRHQNQGECQNRHQNQDACQNRGKPLTLYAHTDTVGYDLWPEQALNTRIDGDKLFGLGACDDKGHCVAMMLLAKKIIDENIQLVGDLHLCFIDDEEGESKGSFDYVKNNPPEACLILESAPQHHINICHQGFGWLKITVGGKAGHGSAGETSADAIARLAEIIVRLEQHKKETFTAKPHELNGETVYHTSYIKGGTDFASYPDSAELGIEIGTQPGETIEDRISEIEAIFCEAKKVYPDLDAKVEVIIGRQPFTTKGTEQLCEITKNAIKDVAGKEAECVGDNSWGDAQIFQDAGFPTLGIGADGGNLHAPNEWISLSKLEQLVHILVYIVKEYCGQVSHE